MVFVARTLWGPVSSGNERQLDWRLGGDYARRDKSMSLGKNGQTLSKPEAGTLPFPMAMSYCAKFDFGAAAPFPSQSKFVHSSLKTAIGAFRENP
jgi:hypothetical protein